MLYINGPYFVNEEDLTLKPNPGSWNRLYGMLFIEQPIGTGYSVRGEFLQVFVCEVHNLLASRFFQISQLKPQEMVY